MCQGLYWCWVYKKMSNTDLFPVLKEPIVVSRPVNKNLD